MGLAEQFHLRNERWQEIGSPPCEHRNLEAWHDDRGEPADGVGCVDCGQWFSDSSDAKRHADRVTVADPDEVWNRIVALDGRQVRDDRNQPVLVEVRQESLVRVNGSLLHRRTITAVVERARPGHPPTGGDQLSGREAAPKREALARLMRVQEVRNGLW